MKFSNFRGSARDFSEYIELFSLLGVNRILDFGCSWGYGVFQFRSAGFDAFGYEVSVPRADFGRKNLNVPIYASVRELRESLGKFDLIFSSHVLEHLPTPNLAWNLFSEVASRGTVLLIEVPNCGGESARLNGLAWGPFSSAVHPLSFTAAYFRRALEHRCQGLHIFSKPFCAHQEFASFRSRSATAEPSGDDLIVVGKLQ